MPSTNIVYGHEVPDTTILSRRKHYQLITYHLRDERYPSDLAFLITKDLLDNLGVQPQARGSLRITRSRVQGLRMHIEAHIVLLAFWGCCLQVCLQAHITVGNTQVVSQGFFGSRSSNLPPRPRLTPILNLNLHMSDNSQGHARAAEQNEPIFSPQLGVKGFQRQGSGTGGSL